MPRGRHRHSPPLHRLLPPTVLAALALACAALAWFFPDPPVLRLLVAAAALAAVVSAVLMRRWDREAGKRVAELTRSRAGAEWRHEERVAELEADLEESRELRTKLEQKIRAKRTEIAGLRNEHAALLRRYANAETERASALEGRRRLAIDAATPARALPAAPTAVPADQATGLAPVTAPGYPPAAAHGSHQVPRQPTPELFRQAGAALERLARGQVPPSTTAEGDPAAGKPRAAAPQTPAYGPVAGTIGTGRPSVPVAATVVDPARARAPRAIGGFDFFGTAGAPPAEALEHEDLADVVGEEALAAHRQDTVRPGSAPLGVVGGQAGQLRHSREPSPAPSPAATGGADEDAADAEDDQADAAAPEREAHGGRGDEIGHVIDLTAHDETEQLDVGTLRTAMRA
ncbi:coiled-coil domain-containing protein [Streptomyces sp. NPDC058373]|uniref:coiled-coil domain-containing protein n=1 Tax=unclassified Streptomyces TaxID=2593676 RepID=UPI0036655250